MPCWYYDKKELHHSPTLRDGIPTPTEMRYRREGARFILDTGIKLGLHYSTYSTGIVYFHRFYMFHSFRGFPRHTMAACCLFLAGKVEETPKKCKDIIKVAKDMLTPAQFQLFGKDPKEELMTLERILLQTIKFDLQVEHPYKYLLKYAKMFRDTEMSPQEKSKFQDMVQHAWTLINDSLCTTLCLQWEPDIIAVAVMYLASRMSRFDLQQIANRKGTTTKWYKLLVEDVTFNLLEDICHQVLDLYHAPPPKKEDSPPPPPPPRPKLASNGQSVKRSRPTTPDASHDEKPAVHRAAKHSRVEALAAGHRSSPVKRGTPEPASAPSSRASSVAASNSRPGSRHASPMPAGGQPLKQAAGPESVKPSHRVQPTVTPSASQGAAHGQPAGQPPFTSYQSAAPAAAPRPQAPYTAGPTPVAAKQPVTHNPVPAQGYQSGMQAPPTSHTQAYPPHQAPPNQATPQQPHPNHAPQHQPPHGNQGYPRHVPPTSQAYPGQPPAATQSYPGQAPTQQMYGGPPPAVQSYPNHPASAGPGYSSQHPGPGSHPQAYPSQPPVSQAQHYPSLSPGRHQRPPPHMAPPSGSNQPHPQYPPHSQSARPQGPPPGHASYSASQPPPGSQPPHGSQPPPGQHAPPPSSYQQPYGPPPSARQPAYTSPQTPARQPPYPAPPGQQAYPPPHSQGQPNYPPPGHHPRGPPPSHPPPNFPPSTHSHYPPQQPPHYSQYGDYPARPPVPPSQGGYSNYPYPHRPPPSS